MSTRKYHSGVEQAMLDEAGKIRDADQSLYNFLSHTIQATENQDLAGFKPEAFIDLLKTSFAKLGKRPTGGHTINMWTTEDTSAPRLIVDIFLNDMPFVVDSVLAAIRATGGNILMFTHPVLPINSEVEPWQVLEQGGRGVRAESFLQVHLDLIADQEVLDAMRTEIDGVLIEVRRTVRGWRAMLERLKSLISSYRENPPDVPAAAMAETLHFLAWLADHNFTFLGMREYRLKGEGDKANLVPIDGKGLGVLEDPKYLFLRDGPNYVEMTPQHIEFLQTAEPLMVTKANVRARVHRRSHMDYIGVKLFGPEGKLTGELRIIGLFTSMSLATPHTEVPLIRKKIAEVMRRSGFEPSSHAGKALMAALDNYPREELFQIGENELFEFATIIAGLPDRPQVRVLPRIDRFDNFVSILTFLPRDRYDSDVRARIGTYFARKYDGRVSAYYPHFPEGDMVRVHFIIGRNGGVTPRPRRSDVEAEVTDLTRTFGDLILSAAEDPASVKDYWDAFSPGYEARNTHHQALEDIYILKGLGDRGDMAVRLEAEGDSGALRLKVYHPEVPIPLSDRVPMLENFGFRVIDETTFNVEPRSGRNACIHVMQVSLAAEEVDVDSLGPRLERGLKAIWAGKAESDGFNQLCVTAGMEWDDIAVLRSLSRYMRQIGTTHSQHYIWTVMSGCGPIASDLIALFRTMHDPDLSGDRARQTKDIQARIDQALEAVTSIDEDRIIRNFLNLITSSLRTNYFQRIDGERRPALATKFDPKKIDGMPAPRPYREIFVYAPRVEGIHLRGGPIARGGLRWSDRPEDFRTEILGLVKAQMTKNSVIVPVGAKGGFVPKKMPPSPDRETFLAEGTACYKIFIGALLDITDNLDGEKVLPPPDVVRHDGDDPYLVVAADKGTATFSDTANAISQSRNFWLDDAFASGGSAGYDHKKMGITARGGWEAVKRHFREMDRDIQTEPFTAVGVGDMSGDVFGNGMLLSDKTKLIAAFDHRDIFIDPNPDPASSFEERKRLFEIGRSSWQDYDKEQLSPGGMIVSRGQKAIKLSDEAKYALDIQADTVTPQQLMTAILCAPADLLWFGGIGTYVRATTESNADAGDRANDAIRITGKQIRAQVIGEGANLGITQLGRIEYASTGGRINTDAIDNSAGVNSSDLEVNIKIALGALVRDNQMRIDERNDFLVEMTEEVAELCLRNNYLQSLILSLTERRGMDALPDLTSLMQGLESEGELDRAVEYLPDDVALAERANTNRPLTRPELAVLLAYSKNTLFDDLLNSSVPDDPYLGRELFRYFPDRLAEKYPETIERHRLRREVIATVLANAMINRGGPAYVSRMTSATSADAGQVALAYAAARDSFGLTELNAQIDKLDNKVKGDVQLALYSEVQTLLVEKTQWFLRNVSFEGGLEPIVQRYSEGLGEVRSQLASLMTPFIAESTARQAKGFESGGTPAPLARRIAELSVLTLGTDVVLLAEQTGSPVKLAAEGYFAVLSRFNLGRITELSNTIILSDHYDRMALDRALANLMRAQRDISEDVLAADDGPVNKRMEAWDGLYAAEIARIEKMVKDLTEGELTVSRLSVAAGLLTDLARH